MYVKIFLNFCLKTRPYLTEYVCLVFLSKNVYFNYLNISVFNIFVWKCLPMSTSSVIIFLCFYIILSKMSTSAIWIYLCLIFRLKMSTSTVWNVYLVHLNVFRISVLKRLSEYVWLRHCAALIKTTSVFVWLHNVHICLSVMCSTLVLATLYILYSPVQMSGMDWPLCRVRLSLLYLN